MAQLERLQHRLAPQVKGAVPEPQRFVDGDVLVDRERRRLGIRQDLEFVDRHLDLSRLEVGVDVRGLAASDGPRGAQHVLGAERVGFGVRLGRRLGVKDELDDAASVSEVDEDEPAVIAAAMDPPRDPRGRVGTLRRQLAAPGVPVGVGTRR